MLRSLAEIIRRVSRALVEPEPDKDKRGRPFGVAFPLTAGSVSFLLVSGVMILPVENPPQAQPMKETPAETAAGVDPKRPPYEKVADLPPSSSPAENTLAEPPAEADSTHRVSVPGDINRGDKASPTVALTFDGGYEAGETAMILDTLKARGVKATIFLTGIFMERHPELTRRIAREGHQVGNHTMTHPHLTDYAATGRHGTLPSVDRRMLVQELKRTEKLYRETTGRAMSPLWRAPYGEANPEIRSWAYGLGYLHVGWTRDYARGESLDTLDWVSDTSSPHYLSRDEIKARVLGFGEAGPRGGIVLMHLGTGRKKDRAAGVLGEILDGLESSGIRPVKVTELIDEGVLERARAKKEGRTGRVNLAYGADGGQDPPE